MGLVLVLGNAGETKPNSGFCIGNGICFTLFRVPNTFTSARSLCREQGGHLMTVRTSVSSDALSILLENVTGSFWIGLHHPSGCPEPSEKLRGFQWVTKDSESDFTNWLPGSDSSCSAARCVSVNGDEKFKWNQTPCDQPAAGFLCENNFNHSCTSLPHEPQESVRFWIPYGFEIVDMHPPFLPLGAIATRSPSRTKYICTSKDWYQAPWACEVEEGGCEHKCAGANSNSPICFCPPGQTVNPENRISCEAERTGDPCAVLQCEQFCYPNGTQYQCGCDQGLQLAADGRSCVDFDECGDERQCPKENSRCVNTPRGFKCVCEDGYKMKDQACVDRNECLHAPCEHLCINTLGSYKCSCYEGYKVNEEAPDKCRLYCGTEECPAVCDPNDRFQCFCPQGYVLEERQDSSFCIDINECESFYCEQTCQNTYGSYNCSCRPGFKLVGGFSCIETSDKTTDSLPMASTHIIPTSTTIPLPKPTLRPSGVTAGGLVGIIVCTVFLVVLAVFAVHLVIVRRGKKESPADAPKGAEDESHGLQRL